MTFAQQCVYKMCHAAGDDACRRALTTLRNRPHTCIDDLLTSSAIALYLDKTYKLETKTCKI